jgi:hypothetical protein
MMMKHKKYFLKKMSKIVDRHRKKGVGRDIRSIKTL